MKGQRVQNESMDINLYIVTGTTKGLGAAFAERIAADAANELIAFARAPEGVVPGGWRIEADLSDSHALARACQRAEERMRGKRYAKAVLINNAGVVSPVGPLDDVDAAALEHSLVVNLVAPMLLMRWFLGATASVPLRRIVNISSGAGRRLRVERNSRSPEMASRSYRAARDGHGEKSLVRRPRLQGDASARPVRHAAETLGA